VAVTGFELPALLLRRHLIRTSIKGPALTTALGPVPPKNFPCSNTHVVANPISVSVGRT
jgi:hypothetical protein